MNRFQVIINKESTDLNVIKNISGTTAELGTYYKDQLIQAEKAQTDILYFENIEFDTVPSTNFQNITMIERTIMNFLLEHNFPKKVCILCDDEEKAKLYKVVYNFYFPGIKAERLDDDSWD